MQFNCFHLALRVPFKSLRVPFVRLNCCHLHFGSRLSVLIVVIWRLCTHHKNNKNKNKIKKSNEKAKKPTKGLGGLYGRTKMSVAFFILCYY